MSERLKLRHDRLYGEYSTEIPVIKDLIQSHSLQRLKWINQFGIPDEFYHLENFSRHEHSIGTMLLLKHLGASEEEQIAGLLHDVSHRAFSHVYDWVVSDYTNGATSENSQDERHIDFIHNSELVGILESHGYSAERLTNYHHFGLLERESPDLCADRVDYSLREFNPRLASDIFSGLIAFDGQIICRDLETSAKFGRAFLTLQTEHWGGYEATARYHQFASILTRAINIGVISPEDFDKDDNHIVDKLRTSSDKDITDRLDYLRQRKLPRSSEGVTVYKKFRYIDPPILMSGNLVRLSEVDYNFVSLLDEAREDNRKGVLVAV